MADDDQFDIDIYGDLDNEPISTSNNNSLKKEDDELILDDVDDHKIDTKNVKEELQSEDTTMGAASGNGDNSISNHTVKEEPPADQQQQIIQKTQPVKRKYPDDRPIDPGATTALYVADLHWWTTDDDIRGWVTKCECEDELKDITFSEHKVNGKSKGAAYVEFTAQQAATAVKRFIENAHTQPAYMSKRHQVNFTNPNVNPFRTLPKDAPQRKDARGQAMGDRTQSQGAPNMPPVNVGMGNMGNQSMGGMGAGPMGGGFARSQRGGFGSGGMQRGGPTLSSGFMSNRGPIGGPQVSPQPGFQTPMGSGFGGPNMGMNQFGAGGGGGGGGGGGFQGPNRGGMNMMRGGMPMRGGRGGMMGGPMTPNMGPSAQGGMIGGGMGGGMGNMGGGMSMGGGMVPGGDMGGGFNPMMQFNPMMGGGPQQGFPTPHFNPAFFPNTGPQQGWGDSNPHPAKRQRPNE